MANFTRNFLAGRMNKIVDQRLLPDGEYVDAMNVRMGSTEISEVGVITNTMGNIPLVTLKYLDGTSLSTSARCIGAIEDSANETIYWFVHDPAFTVGATGKLDLIVSYNVLTNILIYHIISINDGGNIDTILNFNPSYLITGVNIIDNLLFWTDNYNAPRNININRNYPNPVANLDVLNPEAILVIKKPPPESPIVTPIVTGGQENFLETRFICFAYRYRYMDGEYSATSQWSQPAFIPDAFEFSINSMLNEGMKNTCNTAIINYNSGDSLVVGIDLLFKESNKNIIKIIEKLDKANLGIPNNQVIQYSFNNSKIFTVLNEAEILRLYDNVPRYAKAQTIMGNRLMYGNYIEGYDLIDKNNSPVRFEYSTTLITENIGLQSVPDSSASGTYDIDPSSTGESIADSVVSIDLTGIPLIAGSSITFQFSYQHASFTGQTPFPVETTDVFDLDFTFFLTINYSSVYALATSPEFTQAIGTVANIKPVYSAVPGAETSCDGTTFTDQFNCLIPINLDAFTKIGSGINGILEPFEIITTPSSSFIGFQIPAMKYVTPSPPTAATQTVYEYYENIFATVQYRKIATPSSLHSNRGYEVGIVYMDDFNRGTTALVSINNTVFVPCSYCANKNSIQVIIPTSQLAPKWAKRYKFVIKPDQENYETIYSSIFFTDPNTNNIWFLLEGENIRKVENGDKLFVKSDTSGPAQTCAVATVLEKSAKASGFIIPKENIIVLAGVYMKINPNTFNLVVDPEATVAPGNINTFAGVGGNYITVQYPMNLSRTVGYDPIHPLWAYEDYTVPAGSKVTIYFRIERCGTGRRCERLYAEYRNTFTSSRDYDNSYDWWMGDNIGATFTQAYTEGGTSMVFIPGFGQPPLDLVISSIQFNRDATTNRLWLNITSFKSCTGAGADCRRVFVDANIQVFRALDTIIFETEPSDALPDVFFENNLSFSIDSNGYHQGNVQTQTASVPAIVNTEFYNCFSFGNGAESYKIRDSIIAKSFNLGERVTTVAAQDYKAAHRFSDITYSGIYNGESNINKLNDFNFGLSNFKHCESSFGAIELLDGRNTDVLTLQEDKISYVLAEKNLLSDASAGGIITSSPMVLGTQIARTEKYGISFNPESYIQWGYDRFFADAKRGAVIQLKGGDDQIEQLIVISEQNMRTWFRDKFNSSFNYQKLGGFDPYMNEYVLSMNDQLLPLNEQCIGCGISQTFTLSIDEEESKQETYCVDLGPTIGNASIQWMFVSVQEGETLTVSVEYDATIVSSGPVDSDGTINFNKISISAETANITLTYTGDMVVTVTVNCVEEELLNIVEVVFTNDTNSGSTIHNEYRYTNSSFVGPLLSNLVLFTAGASSPNVSRYNITSGAVGTGGFPPESSNMRLSTNKIPPDDYDFITSKNKFRYLRSGTLYANNSVDMNAMLSASTEATPIVGFNPVHYADFVVPLSSLGAYLYLIWDLRSAIPIDLCFANNVVDACCECSSESYYIDSTFEFATSVFNDENMTIFASNGFYSYEGIVRELIDGVLYPAQDCNCPSDFSLALRSSTGIADPEVTDVCLESLVTTVYILTDSVDVIVSGDIVCNTADNTDRFDGGNLYYLISLSIAPAGYEYVCRVDSMGVIFVYELCV